MSDEIRIKWANDRLQRINNGEPITDVYNDLGQYDHFDNPLKHMRLAMGDDRKFLADAYLAYHAAKPPKFACDHCGAFFRVEVVGVHHPKRGVVMCPFCGNEPKKVEEA